MNDTLKQAAQALRDTKPGLAAALEAMAEMQPVGQVLTEAERLRCDLRGGPFIWFSMPAPGALLYAAPIATPEHDARIRTAILREATEIASHHPSKDARAFASDVLAHFQEPTMQSDLKRCLHRRYTVDVAEQAGRCIDCGIEGRMQFVGSDQTVAWNTRAEGVQSPLTREQLHAIKEGECIAAEDAYFKARSGTLDTIHNRRIFEAGFERGYDAALKTSTGEGK